MKRKATLGLVTFVVLATVILAASMSGLTGASAQRPGCCPMEQGAVDKPCPFTPVVGSAKQMMCPKDGAACPCLAELKKTLNLTPEQEQKITASCKQFMTDEAGVFSEMKTRRAEFHKLVVGSGTKAQIAAKVDQITALQSKLMLDAAERFAEVKKTLTPAQQKTLVETAGKSGLMCLTGDRCGMACCCAAQGCCK